MLSDKSKLHIFNAETTLIQAAADFWVNCARQAIAERGGFTVALAGGSSPKKLYQALATRPLEWDRIRLFWGDERNVPLDHAESNFRMVKQALLDSIAMPAQNIHPMRSSEDIEESVQHYQQVIATHTQQRNGWPVFDLIMLGIGADGHTASLFPETTALTVQDTTVTSVWVEKLHSWRISLTFPVLNLARQLMFLAPGEAKAPVIQTIFQQPHPVQYPVQLIEPQGEVDWFVDQAAAAPLMDEK